jgi:alpha-galactosidase
MTDGGARLGGPRRVGIRPGRPFVHRLPLGDEHATGVEVLGLPEGLAYDAETRVIAGRTRASGDHVVLVTGDGSSGMWVDRLELVVGSEICLTPPLGWNSWNCFGVNVTEADVRRAADVLVGSGLADLGWAYVNIDDGWQGRRDRRGRLHPNDKFDDLASLCSDLHALGLKVGIYSSPGPKTCGGFEGSAGHESDDARAFAAWGFDYLKYDWCSAGPIDDETPIDELTAPYRRMREALDGVDRDIVYHVCQYGFGKVWEWARSRVGANAWRTAGDIEDTWESVERIGFGQVDLAYFARPGGWNDPDMLVLGRVGGGWYQPERDTRLTGDEQRTHLTLWALLAAPLLLGCDLAALDQATLDMLLNQELLSLHQDSLGRQACRVGSDGSIETWRKELADGSSAIGLFNRGSSPVRATVDWGLLGLSSARIVRDVWNHRDIDTSRGWDGILPAHGSMLFRVGGRRRGRDRPSEHGEPSRRAPAEGLGTTSGRRPRSSGRWPPWRTTGPRPSMRRR